MCGVIGIIKYTVNSSIVNLLLNGLKKLEYRGYDSSGITIIDNNNNLFITEKTVGNVDLLIKSIKDKLVFGKIGIGHTRWATHGRISKLNAHPHCYGDVAVVHNGKIDNYQSLLNDNNIKELKSETDSAVIPFFINNYINDGLSFYQATLELCKQLKGMYSFLAIHSKTGEVIAINSGLSLLIGINDQGIYFSSDHNAIACYENIKLFRLSEGDFVHIKDDKITLINLIKNKAINLSDKKILNISDSQTSICDKNTSYMLQEINEQDIVLQKIIDQFYSNNNLFIIDDLNKYRSINIIACGSSCIAGYIAKFSLQEYLSIKIDVYIASQFVFNEKIFCIEDCFLFISQSGETGDIISVLRDIKKSNKSFKLYLITNNIHSNIAQIVDRYFDIFAGQEIGVASTKTFTAQLLVMLTIGLSSSKSEDKTYLKQLPYYIKDILLISWSYMDDVKNIILNHKNILFIGRQRGYGIAMEGALKFKELTYIHAESIPAGELKHGSMALIDETMIVVIIIPNDGFFEKNLSSIHEIISRGGKIIALTSFSCKDKLSNYCEYIIALPDIHLSLMPICYTIPLQILAYKVAEHLGNNLDQPRNLAKSVTVD